MDIPDTMRTYSLQDLAQSVDSHKLYILLCEAAELKDCAARLQAQGVPSLNLGSELARFIDQLEDFSYLSIDVFDFAKKLLDLHKAKPKQGGPEVLAVYNLGILLEPALKLNAVKFFTAFSRTAALIIIWENEARLPDRLHWSTQQNNIFLDFTETPLKKLQYAI